jgi:cell division protein FtsB
MEFIPLIILVLIVWIIVLCWDGIKCTLSFIYAIIMINTLSYEYLVDFEKFLAEEVETMEEHSRYDTWLSNKLNKKVRNRLKQMEEENNGNL